MIIHAAQSSNANTEKKTGLSNVFKVTVKVIEMSMYTMHKSTVIPSLNVIAKRLSEILQVKGHIDL